MRAMILAAGLGTRMLPLSRHLAKPALPVLGRPVIAWLLELLAHHGITDVAINLHHLPESVEEAVGRFAPPGMRIVYSREPRPLGTGGGIAAMREFMGESDPSLVLAGDMLLDADLPALIKEHRDSGATCTLLLQREERRAETFGSIGIDALGRIRRISDRFNLGGETRAGVFVGVRVISPSLFESLPELPPETAFEDLSDWLAPALAGGDQNIRGLIQEKSKLVWEPVGTPAEYLTANLDPPILSFIGAGRRLAPGTRLVDGGSPSVLGAGATLGTGVKLDRVVVWEGERVPENFQASEGVFADGTFYFCGEPDGAGRDSG